MDLESRNPFPFLPRHVDDYPDPTGFILYDDQPSFIAIEQFQTLPHIAQAHTTLTA